jgi:hypothetical protein
MKIDQKIELLNKLDTKKLFSEIQAQEDLLENLLTKDAMQKKLNAGYLGSLNDDCAEVKNILADLTLEVPFTPEGKKPTVAALEAWLRQQRTGNPKLANAIKQQAEVYFSLENNRIQIEMVKKRLESLKGLLGLRTAQIEFLRE